MTDTELLNILKKVSQLAITVGSMQAENLGRSDLLINTKSNVMDVVTEIDKRSEAEIIHFIKTRYPEHAVLAEESGRSCGESEYLWVVDPLDGTTNYSQGLPIFAVSIALQYRQEAVLGVVYAPALQQLFTAGKGQGAFLNGKRIHTAVKTGLANSVLATGFPYDRALHPINNLPYFSSIALKARGVRRLGAAAYDLACVAAGRFDGYWEMNLSPWDVCAGMLLVQEAGGEVVHFRQDRGISIIAGNRDICRAIQAEITNVDLTWKDHDKC